MLKLHRPSVTTHWIAYNGKVIHRGYTEPHQYTDSGMVTLISSKNKWLPEIEAAKNSSVKKRLISLKEQFKIEEPNNQDKKRLIDLLEAEELQLRIA